MEEEKQDPLNIRIIGWAGTALVVMAYALNSFGQIDSQDIVYPLLNLIGAVLLGVRVWHNKNWSNVFLEFFWGLIAVISIVLFFT